MLTALIFLDIDNTILFRDEALDGSQKIEYGRGSQRFVSQQNLESIRDLAIRRNVVLVLMTGRRFSNYDPVARVIPHHFAILEHGGEIVCGSINENPWEVLDCGSTSEPLNDASLWAFQSHLASLEIRTERFDRRHSFRVLPNEGLETAEDVANSVRAAIQESSFASHIAVVQNEQFVDVIPSWSGKLSAALRLVDVLKFPSSVSFAAGDGHNDLDILEWADRAYCAGNAIAQVIESVKSRGGYVSPLGGHLGAADILQRLNRDVDQAPHHRRPVNSTLAQRGDK